MTIKTEKPLLSAEAVKKDLLAKYPAKAGRRRAQQMVAAPGPGREAPEIVSNARTLPGVITMRGCTYAGCKGVVLGPTRDIVNITHGPIGCGFYSWLTRRNQTDASADGAENYMTYCFSTDMQDNDIVFGGEKKLKAAIREACALFKPKAVSIFATCPVGLIGDDIHSVAREMSEETGINVFGFSCEGYKGVSQSAGHHIANNGLFKNIIGINDNGPDGKFKINMLGEYNIGGDAFEIERLLEKCGITLVAAFSGNSTYDKFAASHTADLNCVMCHRSINYVAEMMDTKFGIPWCKVNFIGAAATAKSLRKIAAYFEDAELAKRVEEVIAAEMPSVEKVQAEVRPRCEGKTAMLFVGGSRAHHYQELFKEIGMRCVAAGYEFAHRDDYEGRAVLPSIKVDADSRNIEELHVTPDPHRHQPRKSPEDKERLAAAGFSFKDYEGMIPDMEAGALVIDDLNEHEAGRLIALYKPDIFCAGIKEKYGAHKRGLPMKQLHSYDSGGPYAGFAGAVNFYREIDRLVNSNVFGLIPAPWQESPELYAHFAWD
jgi:nitrogenase molybdenum-iron protein alpha chain